MTTPAHHHVRSLHAYICLSCLAPTLQAFGGAGVSQDTPLAYLTLIMRTLRLADGPDEVHMRTLAKAEFKRHNIKAKL